MIDNPEIVSQRRPRVPKVSLDRLYSTRTIRSGRWSPDGKWVCFAYNASGRHNLWIVPAEGGWPLQLTVSNQRQVPGEWSPDGRWILFQSDCNGNEQWDLFVVSTENGEVVNLTRTPEISEEQPRWSPDGKFIAYMSKRKRSASYEIHVMQFETGQVEEVTRSTPKEFSNSDPIWSRDGRHLAYTRTRSDQKVNTLHVVDLVTGSTRRVSPPGDDSNFHAADWSPDGRKLLITSNALNRFSNVALLDIARGTLEWITAEEWECEAGSFHPSGQFVTYERNRDGNSEVFIFDTVIGGRIDPIERPGLSTLGQQVFSPQGDRMLFSYSGPGEPNDLHTYDIGKQQTVKITDSLLASMDPQHMVEPYLVRYESFDGLVIPAFLYVPHNLEKEASHAAIVSVHGGPSAQTMNGFNRSIQYLVNNGYVVIAPNYRGSTGYGKDFEERNRFDMGGGDLQDVIHAARFLETTGYVDARKIAIMGGSYGGYMTMMGLTKSPETWAAGVAIVPFVNWFTELEHEDPVLREWDLATMGDPVQNRTLYEERSPINFIDRIRAPLLVLAGGNDPRCPKEESDQVAEAIRQRGGVVEYHFYENEGHGFARIENAIDSFERTVAFLDQYVK
jgi:dipeptidyl aminopeptidase/acylaminoacyl peptidase